MVVLEQFDHLPAVFTFCKLLQAPAQPKAVTSTDEKSDLGKGKAIEGLSSTISIAALRLIELTDRTSAVMKASGVPSSLLASDTLSTIFRTFTLATLGIPTTSSLSITPAETYASAVAEHAESERSQVIVLPWALKEQGQVEEASSGYLAQVANPFAGLFGVGGKSGGSKEGSPMYASFVRKVFAEGK